jgi:hypothetical protein
MRQITNKETTPSDKQNPDHFSQREITRNPKNEK